ncbi:pentapeptide repeat-containing protein [Pandoraea bronchicola]|uniref:Secreted effector protein PipB2 n=1 Tax=Pandoraea bronchicola TaxID=2508287 RepID=A0A5E5C0E2_9BURK|nr:pentapeptide repeat-containing protein [Pandoraea bronchicola]VVE90792.1 Secreted effector protein PipB2 [Pandoraea bronchicola]
MLSVQNWNSGREQPATVARDIEGVAVGRGTLSSSDIAARSAAPPEALRRAILRAGEDERRTIARQVAWLVNILPSGPGAPGQYASIERLAVRADASLGELPFDKGALMQAWITRFAHLLDGERAAAVARDLVTWCGMGDGQSATASLWHWLPTADEASGDVLACERLPMREWPVSVLSVALTLSNLRNAMLPDLWMPNADLRGVMAPGAQFCGGHFNGTWWAGASLPEAGFASSKQIGADFERTNLRGAHFRAADLSDARFVGADLRGSEILHTVMYGADLSEAKCQGLTFEKARMDNASFQQAKLHGARFIAGSAHGMTLIGAKAKRSQWTSMSMPKAQVLGADLRGAAFRQCVLTEWDARGAKLNGAFFESCDLRNARFCGASLKHLRIGPDCNLAGTQWQDARVRLDVPWLRSLTPPELDKVVRSWMTLPPDQPAARANVFMQLLVALSRKPGLLDIGREIAPPLHRLPEHVRRSDWLGCLLAALSEAGGVGEHDEFAVLRAEWLAHTLRELTDVPLGRTRAEWVTASLMRALHRECGLVSQKTPWALAGAMCQTLYWAGEGGGGVGPLRAQALRAAWFDALPAQVHVALSADGINASDARFVVLIRADGNVAARLPVPLLARLLGANAGGELKAGDAPFARDTLPGWHWLGTRVVVRDVESPGDFLPGTMSQLPGLLREFGFLAGLWPVERRVDAFVRLIGRWCGSEGAHRADAACHGTWDGLPADTDTAADGTASADAARDMLSPADRLDALVRSARAPGHVQLRRAGYADIEDVFRDVPLKMPDGQAPLSASMSRRVRFISLVAGLSWLATQPEWQRPWSTATDESSALRGATPCAEAPRLYRHYALTLLNETMSGDTAWRHLPQAIALRMCLSSEVDSAEALAERLVNWLTCPEIRYLPGLAQACRHTLPWFWAIRLPLRADALRQAMVDRRGSVGTASVDA